jgi:trigger factor
LNIEKVIQEDRQAKLTVEYSTEEFEGIKRRAAKKISKNTKIPGFRPGKAPYQVVLNHYGEGAIIQEAIDILLDDDYGKILKEAEIEPSGVGNLESIESYDPPKFVFLVPLEPEIDLGDYREIRKPFEKEEFDVSKVDDYITNLRRNSATIVPADHPAETGDLVYFNLSGEFLNPGEDEDATITDKTPQQVLIADEEQISENEWPFPGFSRSLLGVKDGDVKEIQHTYPEDYDDEEYQGKTAIFTVEVQSVKALELPELDDDFVQSVGDYDSPDEFRASLEERLRTEHDANYERDYFNDLVKEIIDQSKINFPPQMLEHEEEHVLEDIKSRLQNQKLDLETYLKLRSTDEETFLEEEVRPVAKQRVERSLVLDALVKEESLKLNQEMLTQHINQVMREVFQSAPIEEMQKEMKNEEFSRMISMEGVSRTMNAQLRERLKLIATGQPIPETDEIIEAEQVDEAETKELEIKDDLGAADKTTEEEQVSEDVESTQMKEEELVVEQSEPDLEPIESEGFSKDSQEDFEDSDEVIEIEE